MGQEYFLVASSVTHCIAPTFMQSALPLNFLARHHETQKLQLTLTRLFTVQMQLSLASSLSGQGTQERLDSWRHMPIRILHLSSDSAVSLRHSVVYAPNYWPWKQTRVRIPTVLSGYRNSITFLIFSEELAHQWDNHSSLLSGCNKKKVGFDKVGPHPVRVQGSAVFPGGVGAA